MISHLLQHHHFRDYFEDAGITHNWTVADDLPTRRFNFGIAVVNDTLYAIGGVAVLVYFEKFRKTTKA